MTGYWEGGVELLISIVNLLKNKLYNFKDIKKVQFEDIK